jgi:hypothetical protein
MLGICGITSSVGRQTGGAAIGDTNNISIFQVDFTLKF